MKIAHISDVHIRLKERHQEYQTVFDRLYEDLKSQEVDHIVLAGDIVHSKITMSPELFDMTRTFFIRLLEIAPLHLITGNHDMNMSNVERMDALHPIVESIDNKDLHYYQHTGLYDVPNSDIVFGVNSLVDGKTIHLTEKMKNSNKIYIALYHGALSGCVLDNDYVYEDAKISPHTFDNFDYVLLGDIHKFQQGFRPDGSMAYSGSLIQQNHGESLDKGYLLWDIHSSRKFYTQLRPIENEYGFYTIRADDGKLPDLILPPKTRMRVVWPVSASKISRSEVIRLNSMINEKYNPLSLNLLFRPVVQSIETNDIEFDGMINVRDINVQHDLLQKWANIENIPQPTIDELLKLDTRIHDQLAESTLEDFSNSNWSLKTISIENFMSYSDKIELDFTATPGIIGLFGNNASGKSVIVDAILYALFNKTSRDVKNEELVNKYSDSIDCEVKLTIDIRGVSYLLERKTTHLFRKKTNEFINARTDLIVSRMTVDGDWENITETQRTDTEKIIRNAIGSFDDFLTTTVSIQNGSVEFVNQRAASRADNMLRILGLDLFTKKYEAAKEMLRTLEYEIKEFNRDGELENIDTLMEERSNIIADIDIAIDSEKDAAIGLDAIHEELATLRSKLRTDVIINEPIDKLRADVDTMTSRKKSLSMELAKSISDHDTLLGKMTAIEDQFIFDNDVLLSLSNNQKKEIELLTRVGLCEQQISNQKRVLAIYKKDLANENKCPATSDPAYTTCTYLRGYVDKKEECNTIVIETKKMIDHCEHIKAKLTKYAGASGVLETQSMIRDKIAGATIRLSTLKTLSIDIENKIAVNNISFKLAKSKLDAALLQQDAIEMNIFLNEQISSALEDKHLETQEVDRFRSLITEKTSKSALLARDIELSRTRLERIDEVEEERIVYMYYCNAMHRNGIPVSVLKQYIPKVNYEMNRVLSTVVPFGVYLKVEDDSTKIDIVMRYDNDIDDTRPASMASGMERLMINFAIRYALIAISNMNRPNVWVIDEGFGVLSTENLSFVKLFFDNTRDIFENIVIITHIEELKDIANWVYNIEKKDGISNVDLPQRNI